MRTWLKILLCAVVALASALAVLPARWLIALLPAQWPVAVVDASGTLWRGTALLAVGFPEMRTTLPTPVSWAAAWRDGPRMEIRHAWLGGPLDLRLQTNGFLLSGQTLKLPAEALVQFGAPFNTLRPAGDLSLTWPALRLNGSIPQGELLTAEWRDASTALSLLRPIGHYRLKLNGESGQALAVAISTVSGPLAVEGTGRWTARAGFSFNGVARPSPQASPEARAALQSTLSALGRRSGNDSILKIGR
ncbi:Bacterial type II secretion system protein N [Pigmentiphaga humi]|uniref:Type II secretion system protein N n=1 Tax=Pigmentiphaga humi TaxID=2478468 RepID=A0A3P4AXD2_9BURK|nr:type II secretion system protein N [Pigmentiphaga humi]VCU68677.1 Bacterial type II secretion system protein N [Pigmentiphaga humi]